MTSPKIHLIGVTGLKRSGKDTIANRLVEKHEFQKLAFADPLKIGAVAIDPYVEVTADLRSQSGPYVFMRLSEVVDEVGLDVAKEHPDVRRFLQRYGTEGGREVHGESCWLDAALARAYKLKPGPSGDVRVVFSDVRFENEAMACDELIKVKRPGTDTDDMHPSESLSDVNVHVTEVYDNDGTLADLHNWVDAWVRFDLFPSH